jgi:hypothetical protein
MASTLHPLKRAQFSAVLKRIKADTENTKKLQLYTAIALHVGSKMLHSEFGSPLKQIQDPTHIGDG